MKTLFQKTLSYCLTCKRFVPHDHVGGSRYTVKFYPSHKVVEIETSELTKLFKKWNRMIKNES